MNFIWPTRTPPQGSVPSGASDGTSPRRRRLAAARPRPLRLMRAPASPSTTSRGRHLAGARAVWRRARPPFPEGCPLSGPDPSAALTALAVRSGPCLISSRPNRFIRPDTTKDSPRDPVAAFHGERTGTRTARSVPDVDANLPLVPDGWSRDGMIAKGELSDCPRVPPDLARSRSRTIHLRLSSPSTRSPGEAEILEGLNPSGRSSRRPTGLALLGDRTRWPAASCGWAVREDGSFSLDHSSARAGPSAAHARRVAAVSCRFRSHRR